MVALLICFLLLIVFLAFFVGKNLSNVCTIWFFKTYTDISVATLVFIAFAAGIAIALLVLFFAKLRKSARQSAVENKIAAAEEEVRKSEKAKRKAEKVKKSLRKSKEKEMTVVDEDATIIAEALPSDSEKKKN